MIPRPSARQAVRRRRPEISPQRKGACAAQIPDIDGLAQARSGDRVFQLCHRRGFDHGAVARKGVRTDFGQGNYRAILHAPHLRFAPQHECRGMVMRHPAGGVRGAELPAPPQDHFGKSTRSTRWITPFEAMMSAWVTRALFTRTPWVPLTATVWP
jgi:hypothetical protein